MRYLFLVYSTGKKSLLSPWLQNIHFNAIPVDSCAIPADSSGMASFLQESVGHCEVLYKTHCAHSTDVGWVRVTKPHPIPIP